MQSKWTKGFKKKKEKASGRTRRKKGTFKALAL